jgi:hypothetical protein
MSNEPFDRIKLTNDYIQGKVSDPIRNIIERLFDLADLGISVNLKSTLAITISLMGYGPLSAEKEQKINQALDDAVNAYNLADTSQKNESIQPMIEQIQEIIIG